MTTCVCLPLFAVIFPEVAIIFLRMNCGIYFALIPGITFLISCFLVLGIPGMADLSLGSYYPGDKFIPSLNNRVQESNPESHAVF